MENRTEHLKKATFLGCFSIFFSILGASMTFPYLQERRDNLGCDALCFGSMQSARSGLNLIGSFLVGRLSDKMGRSNALWIGTISSLLSHIINFTGSSITAMWISMVPSSLLNQNFSVLKALFSDYTNEYAGSEVDRATCMGRLGMAVGISFMIGPTIGAVLLGNYYQATAVACLLTLISSIFLFYLPMPHLKLKEVQLNSDDNSKKIDDSFSAPASSPPSCKKRAGKVKGVNQLLSLLHMPAAKTGGARLLFFMRCAMALAFSIFMTVWTVSLKHRFSFGAKDHAYFMGWIGLCYAISQGFLARWLIERTGGREGDPTNILLVCMVALGGGRVLAMLTHSLPVVYFLMAGVIIALGVVNTSISSACGALAGADQAGGLFGLLEALESLGGIFGPTLGGLLHRTHPEAPIVSVVVLYMLVFVAVWKFYRKTIVLGAKFSDAHSNEAPTSETNVGHLKERSNHLKQS